MTPNQFVRGFRSAVVAFNGSQKESVAPHWYMFRSPEIADICSHLTPEEDAYLHQAGRRNGFLLGVLLSVPALVFVLSTSYQVWWAIPFLVVLQIGAATVLHAWMRKTQVAFLASTHYAKANGLTSEKFSYYT